MPPLSEHQSSESIKMMLVGNSGSGKTGALVSLAFAGYNIRVLDFDSGLDVLANYLKNPKTPGYTPEGLSRVAYETITEPMKSVAGKLIPSKAIVWQRLGAMLDNWKTSSEDLGPITSWTSKDVLVLDTLTFAAKGAMSFVMSLEGKLGSAPEQQHWYKAQQQVEGLLTKLYDPGIKCNVIVITHLDYKGDDDKSVVEGFPTALGKALRGKVGRYFNSIVLAKSIGQGAQVKRVLRTQALPGEIIDLKTSAPMNVKVEYPIDTGLAQLFKDLKGEGLG